MDPVQRDHHLRKQLGGLALIAGPVLGFAGVAVAPQLDLDERVWVENIADATNRASIGMVLVLLSGVAGVFGILTLAHLLRERERGYGEVGGFLALVGLVLSVPYIGIQAVVQAMVTSDMVTYGGAADVVAEMYTNTIGVVTMGSLALFAAGMVILGLGLYRAEAVPPVSAAAFALFGIGMSVGYVIAASPVVLVSFAIFALGAIPLGWIILREDDEAWEHIPRFRGFHAITT